MTTRPPKPTQRLIVDRIATALGWVFVACAVFLSVRPGGWVGVNFSAWTESRKRAQVLVEEWDAFSGGSRTLGDDKADLPRLVEFVDYRCRFCRVAHDSIELAMAEGVSGSGFSLGVRYPVLANDPVGKAAAIAAICAAEQGRFAAVHSYLLTDTLWISTQDWHEVALVAEVADIAQWDSCRASVRAATVLTADSVWSERLSVNATPTFMAADGTYHIGVVPVSVMRGWVQRASATEEHWR